MFVWDEAKNKVNIAKHGISFDAANDFDFDSIIEVDRTRDEDGERRSAMVGYLHGKLHTMIYTERGDTIRVISLRRSNTKEEKTYEKTALKN